MRFTDYLDEARRNPELNPKTGIVQELEKYKDDPDVYISYTDIDKIGVNPKFEHNTPVGIYFYPLKEIWDDVVRNKVPFASERPFVHVVKATGLLDLDTYSETDLRKDLSKLESYQELWNGEFQDHYLFALNKAEADTGCDMSREYVRVSVPSPEAAAKMIFYFTNNLAKAIGGPGPANVWSSILRKDLGYKGIRDTNGIIHPNEPMQAIIFSTRDFKVIEKVRNIRPSEDKRIIVKSIKELIDVYLGFGHKVDYSITRVIQYPQKEHWFQQPGKRNDHGGYVIYIMPEKLYTDMSIDDFKYILKLWDKNKKYTSIMNSPVFWNVFLIRFKEPKRTQFLELFNKLLRTSTGEYIGIVKLGLQK